MSSNSSQELKTCEVTNNNQQATKATAIDDVKLEIASRKSVAMIVDEDDVMKSTRRARAQTKIKVQQQPSTTESSTLLPNVLKIILTSILFLFFIGVVILVVLLIEYFHQKRKVMRLSIYIDLQSEECGDLAVQLNQQLSLHDEYNSIDLANVSRPVILLYSADFLKSTLNSTVKGVKYSLLEMEPYCDIELTSTLSISPQNYLEWQVQNSPCLQNMSNLVVDFTVNYVDPKSMNKIPNWVLNLSNSTMRRSKIENIEEYGAPDVFDQFNPSVVIGYDQNVNRLRSASVYLSAKRCTLRGDLKIGVSEVGPHGTVPRNGKELIWNGLVPQELWWMYGEEQ